MEYVKEIVAFGPRPLGSKNHEKVENYIVSHLKGIDVEHDNFDINTSEGHFPVHNILAKFPGTRDGIIVIASHYDTNWPLRNTSFAGANDGGSSSALLLEIANQLRGKKIEGYNVWLLWDDAEESMKLPWDDAEALYGVRHIAQKWQDDGTLKSVSNPTLSEAEFAAKLSLNAINVTGNEMIDFFYDDENMIWGHSVVVTSLRGLDFFRRGVRKVSECP